MRASRRKPKTPELSHGIGEEIVVERALAVDTEDVVHPAPEPEPEEASISEVCEVIGRAHELRLEVFKQKVLEEFRESIPGKQWPDLTWQVTIIEEDDGAIYRSTVQVFCDSANLRFQSRSSQETDGNRFWSGIVPKFERARARMLGADYVPGKGYLLWGDDASMLYIHSQEQFERYCCRMAAVLRKYEGR